MDWLAERWDWLNDNETVFGWIVGLSVLTLIVSFVAVPIIIRRLPYDYFLENSENTEELRRSHPVLRPVFLVLKNLVGAILLIGGLLMLLTPGQGILTLMIGLMLMNFPGKRRLEIWLVRLRPINRAINWIRKRGGKPSLVLPD